MLPPNKHLPVREAAPTPFERSTRQSLNEPAQQPLPLEPAPRTGPGQNVRASRLWLCLHFPLLPLEALHGSRAPCAVFEEVQGVRRILLADEAAREAGIAPGLPINAALALSPELDLEERNPAREAQALRALAARTERYTSMVSLAPPALLLEIAGSLRLFGGLEALWRRLSSDLREHGFSVSMAAAPTPLASAWLAKAGRNVRLTDSTRLAGTIASLPLRYLDWPDSVKESLGGMGLTCIGDCLRLPRQGFARRFGAGLLLQLDRALGRLPDPRASYRAPERFCRECDLQEEEHDSQRLLESCRYLLDELERFLISRQLAVQQLRFSFFHLRQDATQLTLRRRRAGGEAAKWSELLELRFDRLELPAPVIAIRLSSGQCEALQAANDALPFDDRAGHGRTLSIAHLMERLSARMGEAAVYGVTLVDEHRPHYAWRATQALESGKENRFNSREINRAPLLRRRPLWMLPEPVRLETSGGAPSYQGPLQRVSGPERIESGWWDAGGIARDYFVAVNDEGVRLWIYRERRGRADWYLHGLFG
ncbi:MAG TPA: DNA polymerase Y family protein [Woeseiaceae bacterium]|nr:DNA polymerase Y family protein [Woeseiaceae bacterium]